MGFLGRLLLATALAGAALRSAAAQNPGGDDTVDIGRNERALADALHTRDSERIEQLLAPDYVLRGSPDVDRRTWMKNALTLCWGDRSDIDGFRARVYDHVVVASFGLTFYVDPASCRPAVLRSLITDIWTRHDDGWRLRVRHAGPPPPGDASVATQYGLVPELPPTWDVDAELSLVATTGNTSTSTIGAGASLVHRSDRTSSRLTVAFLTSEADGVTRARSFSAQGRHAVRIRERVELYGRGAYARDRFAGIQDRVAIDAGAAYTPTLPEGHELTLEGGIGVTSERRLDATDLRFAAATGTLRYQWTIVPGATLDQDLALTGDLEDAANWRGTSATAVNIALTRVLSVKASHAIEYRNRPVTGFGRLDTRTAVALVISFERRPPAD